MLKNLLLESDFKLITTDNKNIPLEMKPGKYIIFFRLNDKILDLVNFYFFDNKIYNFNSFKNKIRKIKVVDQNTIKIKYPNKVTSVTCKFIHIDMELVVLAGLAPRKMLEKIDLTKIFDLVFLTYQNLKESVDTNY